MLQLRYGSLPVLACGVLAALSACNREGQDQMGWARAALERNNAIEIVATDPKTRTFTVRDKASGELHTVRADEVVAAPVHGADNTATAAAAAPPAASGNAAPAAAATPAPATPAPAAAAQAAPAPAAPGDTDSAATPHTAPSSLAPQNGAESGRVLESGPGYTIKTAGPSAANANARDRDITNAPVERRNEPIVCQGARLLHIDNRNLVFSGDAVSAEDGCEIHITNSRITATGIGVQARAANVHIDNSSIEGAQASIDASEGAQVYAGASHFKGLSRRLDSATFHDLGGNIWN